MVACSCRKKCVSDKRFCYDGNLKYIDSCSCKDCDNAVDDNKAESFDEDNICDTHKDDKI